MDSGTVSLGWLNIVSLVLGTGFVTTIMGWLLAAITAHHGQTKEATYLALRLSVTLEEFAIRCAEVIGNNDMTRSNASGHEQYDSDSIPELASYPEDEAWKLLDSLLSARLLTLLNEIMLAHGTVRFAGDAGDFEAVSVMCDTQAGKCGYRTWILARDLRSRYKLPVFDPKQVSWDVESVLKPHHDKSIKDVRSMNEFNAKSQAL